MVELVWAHHRMVTSREHSVAMVDYLRDSLFEGEKFGQQLKLRVEVDLLGMLSGPPVPK